MKRTDGKLHEECAVFGLYNNDGLDAGRVGYQALFAMQHRGQDGAGLACANGRSVEMHKGLGLVSDVFSATDMKRLAQGKVAIGHTRYATSSRADTVLDTQPLVMHGKDGFMAMAHNGHIVNGAAIRRQLQKAGMLFQTSVDSEALMHLIARCPNGLEEGVQEMMRTVKGSYALALLSPGKLIGVRDPWGIRPLALGKLGNSYLIASESCAFHAVGGTMIRDIKPGEIVIIDENGVRSIQTPAEKGEHFCVFEYVYFARNDSIIDGVSVYDSRVRMGQLLSKVLPVEADLVAGVPDSALPAANGYAKASGIPYEQVLLKNSYSGRTFITGGQQNREQSVRMKLSPIRSSVEGKRIVLVDDSIVRGTNSMYIVRMLRKAGAREVHMRIASPPVQFPCHFGINTPTARRLAAAQLNVDQLCARIEADSLAYLGLDDLVCAVNHKQNENCGGKDGQCGLCCACFSGAYPMPVGR